MNLIWLDTLLEPAVALDLKGVIVYCNESFAGILDSSPRKLIRSKAQFKSCFNFEQTIPWVNDLASFPSPAAYIECFYTSTSSSTGKAQISAQRIDVADYDSPLVLIFFRDVTLEERLQKKYRGELEQKEKYIGELQSAQKQLEIYSKDLEKIVQERTWEIQKLNQVMKTLLDSLDQSFIVFDSKGICSAFYSKISLEHFKQDPFGKTIADLLAISEEKKEKFFQWIQIMFEEPLPFDDIKPLGPSQFLKDGKTIQLNYFPMRHSGKHIENIVLVGSDITALLDAQKQSLIDREEAQSIMKIVRNKNQLITFLKETHEQINSLNVNLNKLQPLDEILRILHTIKGGSATFSLLALRELSHKWEEKIADDPPAFSLSRPNQIQLWNDLNNEFSITVDRANRLLGFNPLTFTKDVMLSHDLLNQWMTINHLDDLKKEIYMSLHCEPAQELGGHYGSLVESLSLSLEKPMHPVIWVGGQTRLNQAKFQKLFQSMIHIFRNAMDHGIETAQERRTNGKSELGKIIIEVTEYKKSNSNWIKIVIEDDGRGIDENKIRQKWMSKGRNVDDWSKEDLLLSLFEPGFSTLEEVNLISGRGVGLDAVKNEIENIGGTISIQTVIKKGTKFILEAPMGFEIEKSKMVS